MIKNCPKCNVVIYYINNKSYRRSIKNNSLCKKCKLLFKELYDNTFNRFKILNTSGYKVYYMWEMDWKLWNKGKLQTFPLKLFKNNHHEYSYK